MVVVVAQRFWKSITLISSGTEETVMKKILVVIFATFILGAASQYTYREKVASRVTLTPTRSGAYLSLLKADKAWPDKMPIDNLWSCTLSHVGGAKGRPTGVLVVACTGEEVATVSADMLPKGAAVTDVIN
jgi:hypothetical protein